MGNTELKPYWNEDHTKYAVLVATNSFLGWSTMNVPELAWDSRVVSYVIEHLKDTEWQKSFKDTGQNRKTLKELRESKEYKEFDEFLSSLAVAYEDSYLPPIGGVEVIWIDAGRQWRIRDGGEGQDIFEFADEIKWISFE